MALHDISSSRTTDLNTSTTEYSAGDEPWNRNTEGFNIENVSTETNSYLCDFQKWHGFYRTIPEFRANVNTFASWIVGRKLILTKANEKILKRIKGNGKDNIRDILWNLKVVSKFCGDAFASITRDRAGRLVNLKPLSPETIRTKANEKGIINKYEQVIVSGEGEARKIKVIDTWEPDEMFHVMNNRIADEIHGIPEVEMLQKIIKWRHQVMNTYSVILHRYMKPTYFFEASTDDETELNELKTVLNNATKNFENVIVPKGTLDKVQEVRTAHQATLDPMPWMNYLKKYFTHSGGVPDMVLGESRESAISSAELNYISYKERVKQEQETYQQDIEQQLGIKIEFEEPREITLEVGVEKGDNKVDRTQDAGKNRSAQNKTVIKSQVNSQR